MATMMDDGFHGGNLFASSPLQIPDQPTNFIGNLPILSLAFSSNIGFYYHWDFPSFWVPGDLSAASLGSAADPEGLGGGLSVKIGYILPRLLHGPNTVR